MAKTEAQKRAQKNYMAKGGYKTVSIVVKQDDCNLMKEVAAKSGMSLSAYIKKAFTSYSGLSFSWDDTEAE